MDKILSFNPIPSKTWNWLKVNDAKVKVPEHLTSYPEGSIVVNAFDNVTTDKVDFSVTENGLGENVQELLKIAGFKPAYISAGEGRSLSKLDFKLSGEHAGEIRYYVPAGAHLTAVMDFESEKEGFGLISTRVMVEEGGELDLVQIHRTGEDYTFLNNIAAKCEDDAHFKLTQIFISGGNTYCGAACDLAGKMSRLTIDNGYRIYGENLLDINYVARHIGEKSESNIHAIGVLQDKAVKRFRGTIDFKLGSISAKGNEKEDVLLLDENVVNQTVPIILCEEEDVEGNHGATIGKISEELMFYMQSRGLTEEEIYKILSTSALDSVCRKVSDEETKSRLLKLLGNGEEDEC